MDINKLLLSDFTGQLHIASLPSSDTPWSPSPNLPSATSSSSKSKGTNKVKAQKKKPSKRRSRKGCESCKRLKIKCNEGKPSCEYCLHRGKPCIYPRDAFHMPTYATATTPLMTRTTSQNQSTPESTSSFTSVESLSHHSTPIPKSSFTDVGPEIPQMQQQQLNLFYQTQGSLPMDCFSGYLYGSTSSMQKLNSVKSQLHVTNLELRLLKFFQNFGPTFFSSGSAQKVERIWAVDVPELWKESEMIRNGLYALSAVKLWSFYQNGRPSDDVSSSFDVVAKFFDNDETQMASPDSDELSVTGKYKIIEKISSYFIKALNAMTCVLPSTGVRSNFESAIIDILIFSFISVHPVPPFPFIAFKDEQSPAWKFNDLIANGSSDIVAVSRELDFFSICSTLYISMFQSFTYLRGTRFENLGYYDEDRIIIPQEEQTLFPFILHLKHYVETMKHKGTIDDLKYISFINTINLLQFTCYISYKQNYPIPVFKSILDISGDLQFVNLLREKDHIACKILFYYTALCSIFIFKVFPTDSMWDKFNDFYQLQSCVKFTNGWEDDFDHNTFKLIKHITLNKDEFFGRKFRDIGMLTSIGLDQVSYFNEQGNFSVIDLSDMNVNLDILNNQHLSV